MRDAALLGARLLLGSYMGIHASQKLFGKFHGPGLEAIGKVFEKNGLARAARWRWPRRRPRSPAASSRSPASPTRPARWRSRARCPSPPPTTARAA